MLTALRLLNIAIWLGLFLYVLPGAWAAARGKDVRRADPWRLSVATVCILIVLGNLRFLLLPDSTELFVAIYVFSAIVGLYKLRLVRAYGRGPKL